MNELINTIEEWMNERIKKSRNERRNKSRNKSRKHKMIIKGGNIPFSSISGLFNTMTYNLSNALSTFTIAPPSSPINPDTPIDPSPGYQNLK